LTKNSEFLGYGDIMLAKNSSQSTMFHFRLFKSLPLHELRKKFFFKDFTIFDGSSFQTEELSGETGCALVDVMRA
jgi:hypothetical protein